MSISRLEEGTHRTIVGCSMFSSRAGVLPELTQPRNIEQHDAQTWAERETRALPLEGFSLLDEFRMLVSHQMIDGIPVIISLIDGSDEASEYPTISRSSKNLGIRVMLGADSYLAIRPSDSRNPITLGHLKTIVPNPHLPSSSANPYFIHDVLHSHDAQNRVLAQVDHAYVPFVVSPGETLRHPFLADWEFTSPVSSKGAHKHAGFVWQSFGSPKTKGQVRSTDTTSLYIPPKGKIDTILDRERWIGHMPFEHGSTFKARRMSGAYYDPESGQPPTCILRLNDQLLHLEREEGVSIVFPVNATMPSIDLFSLRGIEESILYLSEYCRENVLPRIRKDSNLLDLSKFALR